MSLTGAGTPARATQGSVAEHRDLLTALDRALAVIEFSLDGTVLRANENFLAAVGYDLAEVQGQHHRMFCDDAYAASDEYTAFWNRLAMGSYQSGEFLRRTKGGTDLWLQATYNPVIGDDGRPQKVVKLASDITAAKLRGAEYQGKVAAIDRAQAVVEFALDGTVLTANRNFLDTMGFQLDEVQGRHHRVFCEPGYAATPEYAAFWERLGRGAFEGGEYLRFAKGGREVWLQATYNPILDELGRPLKVVKFASDITEVKRRSAEIEARLTAVDRAQAVVEFDLEGIVLAGQRELPAHDGLLAARDRRPAPQHLLHARLHEVRRSTGTSGCGCARARSSPAASSGSATTAARCTSRPPTTRCSTRPADR